MRLISKLFVFTLIVGVLSSCVSKKKFDELTAAKMATDAALAETQANVKTLSEEKDALAADLEAGKAQMAAIQADLDATKAQMAQLAEKLNMTEAELAKVKAQIDGVFADYSESGLALEVKNGQMYVTSDPVTFRSGSSRLNKDQRNAIDALAETLIANPKVKILVEGHTDSKKFKAGTGMDNWDLSIRRANSIVRRLIKKGVSPSQLTVSGAADGDPIGDNETAEGREMNRRSVLKPNANLSSLKN